MSVITQFNIRYLYLRQQGNGHLQRWLMFLQKCHYSNIILWESANGSKPVWQTLIHQELKPLCIATLGGGKKRIVYWEVHCLKFYLYVQQQPQACRLWNSHSIHIKQMHVFKQTKSCAVPLSICTYFYFEDKYMNKKHDRNVWYCGCRLLIWTPPVCTRSSRRGHTETVVTTFVPNNRWQCAKVCSLPSCLLGLNRGKWKEAFSEVRPVQRREQCVQVLLIWSALWL